MYFKLFIFTFFILLNCPNSNILLGQDNSSKNQKELNYRIGISTKLFLIPQRSLFIPQETFNSDFYKQHFGKAPPPSHIDRDVVTFQSAVNLGIILNPYSDKYKLELGLDIGYQTSGTENDSYINKITNSDTNYNYAEIDVDYNLHELSTGLYLLFKTNFPNLNLFAGAGIEHYVSFGKADVSNIILGNTIDEYKTKYRRYSNLTPYLPMGLEFSFGKQKNYFFKIMGSVRYEKHKYNFRPQRLFLAGGFQLQYQFN